MQLEFNSSQIASDPILDSFHVGLVVTDSECNILSANTYACDLLSFQFYDVLNANLNDLMTRPSKIMYESYIIPILLRDKVCDEVQITLFDNNQIRKDLLSNISLDANGEFLYWSFVSVEKRKAHISALLARNKENEAIIQKLQREKECDALTGLYTRQYFFEDVARIKENHKYNRKKMQFLMYKLDSIKAISAHSYEEEDVVLIKASEILNEYNDVVSNFSRLSGSVFVGSRFFTDINTTNLIEIELTRKLTLLDKNVLSASLITTTGDIDDVEYILRKLRHSLHKGIML